MRDPAPLTLQRVLTLRQFAGLDEVELAELATVAENMVERTFAPGTVIVDAGERFPGAYFIVQGELSTNGRAWGPRAVVGGLPMIAGRDSVDRVVANTTTRALLLPAQNYAELLEDNYGVLSNTRRVFARELLGRGAAPVTPTSMPRVEPRALGMVERILVLRAHMPFARLQALSALAQAAEELELPAGSHIHRVGEEPAGPLVILDGHVRLRSRSGIDSIGSTVLGLLEAFAELPHSDDAHAVSSVRAMRVPSAALFDVMEDHTDFAIAILRSLASELLDVVDRVAPGVN